MGSKHFSALSRETGWRCKGELWSNLNDICVLLDITTADSAEAKDVLFQHVRYKTGQRIYSAGQEFDNLYIVNGGFIKSSMIDEYGDERILNFPMKGDVLAIDGIHTQQHTSYASALSDCDVIIVPFKALLAIQSSYPELNHLVMTIMGRELSRERSMLYMLSVLGAEAKVARFLTNLGTRFGQLGYSGKVFNLRMTRHEIASYLGLAIETVSRTLSAFHDMGLIDVERKKISLIDLPALKTLRKLPPARAVKSSAQQAQNKRPSEAKSVTMPEKMKKIVSANAKISVTRENKELLSAVN